MKWVKIRVDKMLRGDFFSELTAEERGIWLSLLVLAADRGEGMIELRKGVAYKLGTLAEILNIPKDRLLEGLKKLKKLGKISVMKDGRIVIVGWDRHRVEEKIGKLGIKALREKYGDDLVDYAFDVLDKELKEGSARRPRKLAAYIETIIQNTLPHQLNRWKRQKAKELDERLKAEYYKNLDNPKFTEFLNLSETELKKLQKEARKKLKNIKNPSRESLELTAFKLWQNKK